MNFCLLETVVPLGQLSAGDFVVRFFFLAGHYSRPHGRDGQFDDTLVVVIDPIPLLTRTGPPSPRAGKRGRRTQRM